jgi:hypothetical protein
MRVASLKSVQGEGDESAWVGFREFVVHVGTSCHLGRRPTIGDIDASPPPAKLLVGRHAADCNRP